VLLLESAVIYEGLQDQFSDSITSNSSLLLDATLQLSVGQYKTMQYKLIEQDVPICSAFEASRYNQYGDCPADGEYSFDTPFDLPAAKSSFADWAVSGYDGAVVIKIYFDSSLVGQCSIQASTIQSQSSKMPSGKIGAMAVATLIFLSLLYIISICLVAYCCKKRKGRVATDVDSENSDSLSEPSTRYSRMEAGSAVQRTDNAADFQPVQGPTRSFGAGSLI